MDTNVKQTGAEKMRARVSTLLRARNPILWVSTVEELRAERAVTEAAGAAGYAVALWDCASGLRLADGTEYGPGARMRDVDQLLQYIRDTPERRVYVLRDLHRWLGTPVTDRSLRSLARIMQAAPRPEARAIVVVTPDGKVPADLRGDVTALEWPRPDRAELGAIYDDVVRTLDPKMVEAKGLGGNGKRDAAIGAAMGLTANAAGSCLAESLVETRDMDPAKIAAAKKTLVEGNKALQVLEPHPDGLAAIGGNGRLKAWAVRKAASSTAAARKFGVRPPRGVFLTGVPGTGKSLAAKCFATAFGCPLLKLDVNANQNMYVGESGRQLRETLATIDAFGRCVVWVDEIEKALAGGSGQAGDGGVSADFLGQLLSWLQDRPGESFVVVTANKVEALPPELMRKGRFDEVFFVDLPTARDRAEILAVALRENNRAGAAVDGAAVAAATVDWTGSEIASLVPEAIERVFAESSGATDVDTAAVLAVAAEIVPMARLQAEQITTLREWAKGRARLAADPEIAASNAGRGGLDL